MDFRLERQCPFIHPDTPQWHWCGRPCFCRPFIIEASARQYALTPGNSKAPNYDFDIMPGDRQPGFKPHPGYGDFRKHKPQNPEQRAKADAVAASLPHTGFGLLTHRPKPKPQDVEDATVVTDSVTDNLPAVTDAMTAAERAKAYRTRKAADLREKERLRKAAARAKREKAD